MSGREEPQLSIKARMLAELGQEMATTRRLLERVPEKRAAWQPHPKSKTLGELAVHLARIPGWIASVADVPSFDMAPPGGRPPDPVFESTARLLQTFDDNVTAVRSALARTSEDDLATPWTMQRGGKDMLRITRADLFRVLLLNHMIHHRGQLTVYLRLNDVPLPIVYGRTADEQP